MIQRKRFITVLSAVTVCMTFAAGFTTQAALAVPSAAAISGSDKKIENTTLADTVQAVSVIQTEDTKKAAAEAKAEFDRIQKQILEEKKQKEAEEKRKAEEDRIAAEEAQRVAEEAAQAEAMQAAESQSAPVSASAGELELLASIIFCEAGNQPYEGQVAVGAVIMNRVNSGVYPNSISEVIHQSGQFGPAMTGWLDTVIGSGGYTDTAMQAAADALAGSNPVGDCLYFGNGDWGIQIGDHFFH